MTTQSPIQNETAAQPLGQPRPTSPVNHPEPPAQRDPLEVMAEEIRVDRRRIKQLSGPVDKMVSMLVAELGGTTLDYQEDLVKHVAQIRNHLINVGQWAENSIGVLLERVEALEVAQDFDGGTQLVPEDAQLLNDVVTSCKALATSMVTSASKGEPLPIPDENGKNMLLLLLQKCEQAEHLIADSLLPDVDEDGEGDEEEGDQQGEESEQPP